MFTCEKAELKYSVQFNYLKNLVFSATFQDGVILENLRRGPLSPDLLLWMRDKVSPHPSVRPTTPLFEQCAFQV